MTERKILYSPGYGAGWVSWHSGVTEELKFMLEYLPFVEALEAPEDRIDDPLLELFMLNLNETLEKYHTKIHFCDAGRYNHNLLRAIPKFIKDWEEKFPGSDIPYLGGLRDLKVATVHGLVRITEYDGNESFEEQYSYDGWL